MIFKYIAADFPFLFGKPSTLVTGHTAGTEYEIDVPVSVDNITPNKTSTRLVTFGNNYHETLIRTDILRQITTIGLTGQRALEFEEFVGSIWQSERFSIRDFLPTDTEVTYQVRNDFNSPRSRIGTSNYYVYNFTAALIGETEQL